METEDEPTLEELLAILDRAETEQVAAALASALMLGWSRQVQQAMQVASQALQGGAKPQEVIGIMQVRLSGPLRNRVSGDVQQGVRALYQIGQREVGASGVSEIGERTISSSTRNTLYWVENHHDRFVQERIRSLSNESVRDGLGTFRSGRRFASSKLGQQFQKSRSYWELLSNATATRTRELSHIYGFVSHGVVEVVIDATIDARTSCICRTLDRTRLPVEALAEWKEEMLEAGDPDDIKSISPWLSCERIRTLEAQGAQALIDEGVVSPPFHGHCRSRLSRPIR